MGSFSNGLTAAGTQLPAVNGGSPTVTYAGGLGVASGVCLCTGVGVAQAEQEWMVGAESRRLRTFASCSFKNHRRRPRGFGADFIHVNERLVNDVADLHAAASDAGEVGVAERVDHA